MIEPSDQEFASLPETSQRYITDLQLEVDEQAEQITRLIKDRELSLIDCKELLDLRKENKRLKGLLGEVHCKYYTAIQHLTGQRNWLGAEIAKGGAG